MELRIDSKSLERLVDYLDKNNIEVIQKELGKELTYWTLCEWLSNATDNRLEDYFDTFCCLNHASYSDSDKDFVIVDRGIKELTDYLKSLDGNEKYEYQLETVAGDNDEITEKDVYMWLKGAIAGIIYSAFQYTNIDISYN